MMTTKKMLGLAGMVLLGSMTAAVAAPIVQTQSIPSTSTNWGPTALTFNQFNPLIGTLNSIGVSMSGSVDGSAGVENLSTTSGNTISWSLGSLITLSGSGGLSLFVTPSTGGSDPLPTYDGTTDFGGTSGITHGSLSASGGPVTQSLTGAAMSAYVGFGTINVNGQAIATSSASGGGNTASTFSTNAGESVTITYNYTPFITTPEPASLALLGAGLLGLGIARRRRS